MSMSTDAARNSEKAGYHIIGQVIDILHNRETVSDETLLRFSLNTDLLSEVYDSIVGPAVDRVESLLLDMEQNK